DEVFTGNLEVTVLAGTTAGPVLRLGEGDWRELGLDAGMYLSLTGPDGEPLTGSFRINHIDANGDLHLTKAADLDPLLGDTLSLTQVTMPAVVFDETNWYQPVEIVVAADNHFVAAENTAYDMTFAPQPNVLDRIQGPLILNGGVGDTDRSLSAAIMLPGEKSAYLDKDDDGDVDETETGRQEAKDTDRLIVHADASVVDLIGKLTSTHLSGLGMGEGWLQQDNGLGDGGTVDNERGIHYFGFEVVELLLGSGSDQLTIDADPVAHHGDWSVSSSGGHAVLHRSSGSWLEDGFRRGDSLLVGGERFIVLEITQNGGLLLDRPVVALPPAGSVAVIREMPLTVVHGGGGDDHIRIVGGYEAQMPLIVFGDTSRSGERYSAVGGQPSRLAQPFTNPGNNVLDASQAIGGVVLVGGAGNDTLIGGAGNDQLFGGGGNNTLDARVGGNNHLYGNGSIDVDLSVRLSQAERVMTLYSATGDVPHATGDRLVAGNNHLYGGDGNDILIGDHGVIELEAREGIADLRLLDSQRVISVHSTDPASYGHNHLEVTGGRNILIGGSGNDTLQGGSGDDILIGDHGDVYFGEANAFDRIALVTTRVEQHDGNDTLHGGEGNNVIFGGQGNDTIDAGDGRNTVLGDLGRVEWNDAGIVVRTMSTDPGRGGNNRVTLGNGGNVVVGGDGNNTIHSGDGNDLLAGDHAEALFDENGVILSFTSLHFNHGGNDTIDSGAGNDWIIGGHGNDRITVTSGDNVVLGDNGRILARDGIRQRVESLDTRASTGGNDVIHVGTGNDQVIAGVGNDHVTNVAGETVIIGDVGVILSDARGRYTMAETGRTDLGGDNLLFGGSDRDIMFGGKGNDYLNGGPGNDILFGDFGRVTRTSQMITVETINHFEGGNDTLITGPGRNISIGGAGNDRFDGNFDLDTMIGEYARIRIMLSGSNEAEQITSIVTLAQGRLDLIRQAQQNLYEEERDDGVQEALGWLDMTPQGLLGNGNLFARNDQPGFQARGMEGLRTLIDEWVERQQGAGSSGLRTSVASSVAASVGEASAPAPSQDTAPEFVADESGYEVLEAEPQELPLEETELPQEAAEEGEPAEITQEVDDAALEVAGLIGALAGASGWGVARAKTNGAEPTRMAELRREQAACEWQRLMTCDSGAKHEQEPSEDE
ncbi:MAG: calcium-binding protein, partial [Billgrantia desiderata]